MKRARDSIEFNVEEFKKTHDVTDDYMVLGIDEAGRGPVIGPMVYCAAMVSLGEHDRLVDECCVADSKMLTEEARQSSLEKFKSLKSFRAFEISVTPEEIAETMTGRSGKTLNTLSHLTAVELIVQATNAALGKLVAVYVDTVGIPEMYQRFLSGRFPHLRVVVSKKADSKFPIVSAASVVAKTTRDAAVKALGIPCGSGYPGDPQAKEWITTHLHRYFVFSEEHKFVRLSWQPIANLAKSACCLVEFERDVEKDNDPRQPKLSFAKTIRRDPVFSHVWGLKYANID